MKLNSIDLYKDWLEIIKEDLLESGYNIDNHDNDKIAILYYSLQKRMISQKPRTINKHENFVCPSELLNGLSLIEDKIKNGDDLKPHQSKKLKKFDDKDGLLYDWGIYHFHLGTEMDSDGFIKRTGPLLYAMIKDENAYFIGVFNHGAWTMQEMLKIIHDNWPSAIIQYKLEGVTQLEKNFDDNEIKHLRGANINTILEIAPSAFYMGPGGGIAGSGDSADAVLRYQNMRRQFVNIEKNLRENPDVYLNQFFKNLDFSRVDLMDFELVRKNDIYYVLEKNYGFSLRLNN